MAYRYISDLRPNITDKWQINVMVSRSWTTYNPFTNRVLSFDVILSDERDFSIHARIPYNMMNLFTHRLEEGCVYRLHRFVVLPYDTAYRPLRREWFVQFTRETSISPSKVEPSLFRRYVFEFAPFKDIVLRDDKDTYLTDVVGVLREWGPIDTHFQSGQSCNQELRHIVLRDEHAKDLDVSLWGPLALKYTDEDIRKYASTTVVVILTSCKIRLFRGASCLVSTSASKFYINLSLPVCDVFKNLVMPPVTFSSVDPSLKDSQVHSLADVYRQLQAGVAEGTMFNIGATIVDVDLLNDWKYVQCSTCRKKAQLIDDVYYCSACQKKVTNPRQAYKIVVRIVDKDEEMTCVLFDDAAISLLHITTEDLVIKSLSEGVDDPYWIHNYLVDALLARSVIFRIKVDRFNLAPHYFRRFTVSKHVDDSIKMTSEDNRITMKNTSSDATYDGFDYDVSDEGSDFLARITSDEWQLADEAMWGPPIPTPSSITTMTSLPSADNEDTCNSRMRSQDVSSDDVIISTTTDVEDFTHEEHEKKRPRRSTRKPKRFSD